MAWSTGRGSASPPLGLPALLEDLLERRTADVLHDDVAGAGMGHEVEDLHDVGVVDLGEEPALGHGNGHGRLVAGVEQALEDRPAVGHRLVPRQVDPSQAAMGQGAGDLVLAADQIAGVQLGHEVEGVAALGAEPLEPARLAALAPADGRPAVRAEPLLLADLRVGHDDRRRVDGRRRRHLDQAGADRGAPARGAGPAADGSPGATGAGGACFEVPGPADQRRRRGGDRRVRQPLAWRPSGPLRGGAGLGRRSGDGVGRFRATGVAVAVGQDPAGAAGLGAAQDGHQAPPPEGGCSMARP